MGQTRPSPGSADCSTTPSGTWNTGTSPWFHTARTRPPVSAVPAARAAAAAPHAAAAAVAVDAAAAAALDGAAARGDATLGKSVNSHRLRPCVEGSAAWPSAGQTAGGGDEWGGGRVARQGGRVGRPSGPCWGPPPFGGHRGWRSRAAGFPGASGGKISVFFFKLKSICQLLDEKPKSRVS